MIKDFYDKFMIKIDTSDCKSLIAGYDIKLNDTWYYSDQIFESGKIYGLVSEYGQGCAYLSYLLGGRIEFGDVRIYCNDNLTFQDELREVSWNLEPLYEPYGKKKVRKSIEKVLLKSSKEDFQTIAYKFLLTERRYEMKYKNLSGERWRAASAFGYVQNKKIYFAPYMPSKFYYNMCQSGLLKALRELAKSGALVILPVGSDEFIKYIADKVIYLNRSYDIDSVRSYYDKHFGGEWIH